MASDDVGDLLRRSLVDIQAGGDVDHLYDRVLVLAPLGSAGQSPDLFRPGLCGGRRPGGRDDLQLAVHKPAVAGVLLEVADRDLAPGMACGLRVEAGRVSLDRHQLARRFHEEVRH